MIVSEHYFTAGEGVLGGFVGEELRRCADDEVVYVSPHVAHTDLFKSSLNLLTFCVLVLRNGFTVTGESACVSPENFDAQIGRDIARKNAVEKMWPLMGFKLACDLQPTKE